MRLQLFGRSGLRVSELQLGAMTFGQTWGVGADKAESRAIFDAFVEAGGNFFDTGHVYTDGLSEAWLGEFVNANSRDDFVIATKYASAVRGGPMNAGNSRKTMMRHVEESLRRLGCDYIDLYYVHFWDFTTPLDEMMRGFDDLVRQGKILYVAASDMPAWEVSRANMMADLKGWTPFTGLQIEYSLAERTAERDLLPMAKQLGLGVVGWGPLNGGALSGKYLAALDAPARKTPDQISARTRQIAELVVRIAREIGATPSQVAIAWIRAASDVLPILGARTTAQLDDNLGALAIKLDPAHLAALDEVSRVDPGFPHGLLASDLVAGFRSGGRPDAIDLARR